MGLFQIFSDAARKEFLLKHNKRNSSGGEANQFNSADAIGFIFTHIYIAYTL